MAEHLTMEEVHQIAYLTMHGWQLSCGQWSKQGFQRAVNKTQSCGCCAKQQPTTDFELEDAYYAELEAHDVYQG